MITKCGSFIYNLKQVILGEHLFCWGRVAVFHLFGFPHWRFRVRDDGIPRFHMMGVKTCLKKRLTRHKLSLISKVKNPMRCVPVLYIVYRIVSIHPAYQ